MSQGSIFNADEKEYLGQFIYTPQESTAYAMQEVETLRENKHRALKFPVPIINDYFRDVLPGQICAVIAQASNYKSGLIDYWAEQAAYDLMNQGRGDEVIVMVKVEDTIEEQIIAAMAARSGLSAGDISSGIILDWDRLEEGATYVGSVPIFRIGESLARSELMLPDLHMSNIAKCIDYLAGINGEDDSLFGRRLKIGALFIDYLQALPYDPEIRSVVAKEQMRRLQVTNDIRHIRRTAQRLHVPTVVGVQAKQKLDNPPGPNMLIPSDYDGSETASIATLFDRVVTMWMPKRTHTVGQTLEHNGYKFIVEEDCLWVKVAKQRGKLPSGKVWKCKIDFATGAVRVVKTNAPPD